MFDGCSGLTSLDVTHFDTSQVVYMYQMFDECGGLTSLDISSFDTSKVTSMQYMFYNCTNLQTIYVSDSFVTTNVTSSGRMFGNDTRLVGGAGTRYSVSYIDMTRAHIDGGTSNPGYFTRKT